MTREEQIKADIDRDIEERTNQIWALVRENRHSLDSERYCRLMREAMNAAIASVCDQIAPILGELDLCKEKLAMLKADSKQTIATLEAEVKASNSKLAKLRKEVSELRDKAVEVH